MTEQRIERTIRIGAPAAAVWAAVRDFGGHGKWMPGAAQGAAFMTWSGDPNRPGTQRRFAAPGQPVFAEQLNRIDDAARQIAYSIVEAPLPIEGHEATITVTPDGVGSIVSWAARFTSDAETARELDSFMGTQNFEPGLAGLKTYAEDGAR